jgi:hypothetical protein
VNFTTSSARQATSLASDRFAYLDLLPGRERAFPSGRDLEQSGYGGHISQPCACKDVHAEE